MENKKFKTVFSRLDMPGKLMAALGESIVRSVKLHQEEKRLCIDMESPGIISEAALGEFRDCLSLHFPYVENMDVKVRFMTGDLDNPSKIRALWDNLIYAVNRISPLCKTILENTSYRLDGNKLYLASGGNGEFIFTQKGVTREIENYVRNSLDWPLQVVFEKPAKETRGNQEKMEKLETEAFRSAVLQAAFPAEEKKKPDHFKAVSGTEAKNGKPPWRKAGKAGGRGLKVSSDIQGYITSLSENFEEEEEIIISGVIFRVEKRDTKSGKLIVQMDVTDGNGSATVKFFTEPERFAGDFSEIIREGAGIKVFGTARFDQFSNEICIMAREFAPHAFPKSSRRDNSPEKRVELHLHTNMSSMDAVTGIKSYVKRAKEWGHTALAVTDHGVVQAYPDAMEAAKASGIKILYGIEAYIVDDLSMRAAFQDDGRDFSTEFVAFDLETTGLYKETCEIIEIGGVKIRNGGIVDTFSALIHPGKALPEEITRITGITDDMLRDKPSIEQVLPQFTAFVGNAALVAHNAEFDMGFYTEQCRKLGYEGKNPYVCTYLLSQILYPALNNFKLNTVAKHLGVELINHHRAVDDAAACGNIFIKMLKELEEKGVSSFAGINFLAAEGMDVKKLPSHHGIILVQNKEGLRNLYELISLSHLEYFYKRPRMPKSLIMKLREGLLLGTACDAGELYKAIQENKPLERIHELCSFYDYYEIQPLGNSMHLYRSGAVDREERLVEINKEIVALGEKFGKPVAATCDVHFLEPEDEVYRRILMTAENYKDADIQPPLYYRTTEEMLAEFQYLGEKKAYEVVVANPNRIADMIEEIKPIPSGTFPPKIEGSEEELTRITTKKAKEIYGDPLPAAVAARLDRELGSIVKNGFAVLYIIAQKLVWDSVEHGYLVGSRGSVGSSLVATMAEITEVNPLPPHYYCGTCKYSDFDSPEVLAFVGGSGCDMPSKACPVCGETLLKDGHDIPFETFLGFDGDKEPDIDLNFSGEYQGKAHAYTEELFGQGYVFKAGTIGTIADKTAVGFVKKYLEKTGRSEREAEIRRLAKGCEGIKRTTGQHPGGLVIVPSDRSIYEFTPVQRPANDVSSDVVTTHFDYHSISGRLLKLDILGHDVPTIIRMLHDMTGVDPRTVDLGDKEVLSLFMSPAALGVTPEDIRCKTGSLGLPEFGTGFVRQMLLDTEPNSFGELVRISGLSHGTNVWLNNAHEIIKRGTATLKEIIPTRDDIMVYLINKGVEKLAAFKIMENVRKGKGLTEAEEETMAAAGVPEWYINSCKKIEYLFPKGHAVAYVMMTVRIGYFKIHYPHAFYAAAFSVKAEDFDYLKMCKSKDRVLVEMRNIQAMGNEASAKDKNLMTTLELVLEMYARGLKFVPLNLYSSHATKFQITGEGLLPPLCTVQGLGQNAAAAIVEARKDGEFFSVEDFRLRTKTTKTVIELLKENSILDGLPETAQLSFA